MRTIITQSQNLGIRLACGAATLSLALGAPNARAATQEDPSQIYFNGQIVTMDGPDPRYVEALVVQKGRIAFVGSQRAARAKFPHAVPLDLAGHTLLPGFIDSHSHMYLTGFLLSMANIYPGPDGPADDFDGLVASTKAWMESDTGKQFIQTFGWVLANGYDHTMLREGDHPTAEVLDRITTDYPVLALHQSGHMAAMNHKGLETVGFTKDTKDPAGGVIRRDANGFPNGVIEESLVALVGNPILSRVTPEIDTMSIQRGQDLYARYGYTTAEEARAYPTASRALEKAADQGQLRLDVISYPDIVANGKALESRFLRADRAYTNHYRIGGAKISLDGAVQSKTAWLSHPYLVGLAHTDSGYRGYPALPDDKAQSYFNAAASKGIQILCHANGDAAIDQCLNGIEASQKLYPNANHRSVIIHGQTMRADQVLRVKALGALPSFFAAHTFYWGDYHRESSLGSPRADRISPTRDALNAGLTLTTHHDSPVIMPNAMRVVDATVNRTTRSGKVLGANQRLTPYEALKAVTIWAAIQHFEEQSKGTLTKGKEADLVLLSDNPLTIEPARIHTIRALATIKDGVPIYCAEDSPRTTICNQP